METTKLRDIKLTPSILIKINFKYEEYGIGGKLHFNNSSAISAHDYMEIYTYNCGDGVNILIEELPHGILRILYLDPNSEWLYNGHIIDTAYDLYEYCPTLDFKSLLH